MNTGEAILILRKVKAHCPSQLIDEYTPEAWAEVLDDTDFNDACAAVVRICKRPLELGKSRYIEPGHIIAEVSAVRSERLRAYGTIRTPDMDYEDAFLYFHTYMREISRMIATGELTPGDPQPTLDEIKHRLPEPNEGRRALSSELNW